VAAEDRERLVTALVSEPPGELGRAAGPGTPRTAGQVEGAAGSDGEADRRSFTARELAILDYADRVTVAPASVTEADLVPLRDSGLDDRGIHDVCAITAYYAFVNRLADGLGVELEADREHT
jgi:alkylhydroperoxidase family enzyme